ncbi:hypothetical protein T4C_1834 [Trichinella pseudospiralis]|uniref:Uncharacterized protein n=1 Tax=Trichinella pseudospiralis TaxID=6337 RepID=A0A0V1GFS9_TRIPS|nr:hypothetical protein T4C_1834 [Trichinella pseudospiralis]
MGICIQIDVGSIYRRHPLSSESALNIKRLFEFTNRQRKAIALAAGF